MTISQVFCSRQWNVFLTDETSHVHIIESKVKKREQRYFPYLISRKLLVEWPMSLIKLVGCHDCEMSAAAPSRRKHSELQEEVNAENDASVSYLSL